jgi:hypothetical protein
MGGVLRIVRRLQPTAGRRTRRFVDGLSNDPGDRLGVRGGQYAFPKNPLRFHILRITREPLWAGAQ